jgi:hypothetical protein
MEIPPQNEAKFGNVHFYCIQGAMEQSLHEEGHQLRHIEGSQTLPQRSANKLFSFSPVECVKGSEQSQRDAYERSETVLLPQNTAHVFKTHEATDV